MNGSSRVWQKGGSHLLSLAGRQFGQESLEFVGQEAGRGWRARRALPGIQVLKGLADDAPVFDRSNDLHPISAARTGQGIHLVDLLE